ncbi:MAG: enoyl-CoA hydratase/isomerase family protein [Alphaproteobacteria bacterium]|jgi:enoyl-CoA hydratase|nr:enoyl-CoA hydratase/isomerase family protein [Alphaproteobacteria bacterium]
MSQITTERDGAVLIATIANPPHGYMDAATEPELTAVLDEAEADDAVRAVVLTGGLPDVFVRHYDVGVLETLGRDLAARGLEFDTSRPVPESPYHVCLRRIATMPKGFVAAINGTAMGGGFELALACDIRLAKNGPYWLGLPEINVGLLPGAGGTQRLARLIGEGRALELILQGRTLSPADAAAWGLVGQCVDGDVVEAALAIAHNLAAKPPVALVHIKRLIRGATSRPLDDGLADERTLFCDTVIQDEAIALMADLNSGARDIRSTPPDDPDTA